MSKTCNACGGAVCAVCGGCVNHGECSCRDAQLDVLRAEVERLRALISEAVDCWFNHDKRGDHAEMQAMYALRDEVEFPKGGEE